LHIFNPTYGVVSFASFIEQRFFEIKSAAVTFADIDVPGIM